MGLLDAVRHAATMQAYTDADYRSLLSGAGFTDVRFVPSLTGDEDGVQPGLFGIVARRSVA